MFKKKTVFVIGAGGSADFGLPLGEGLKGLIAETLYLDDSDPNRPLTENSEEIIEALRSMNASRVKPLPKIQPYLLAGVQISEAMPLSPSIDNFLQVHSQNEAITTVGKLGIAHSILRAERNSKLWFDNSDNNNKLEVSKLNDTWMLEFVKILLEGVRLGDISSFVNVEIITFNYDRCIEESLSNAIANQWLVPIEEARLISSNIKITHVYGTVGLLPWQNVEGHKIEFGAELNEAVLNQAASMLQTFSETKETDEIENEILMSVRETERIVFIGFSFMPINMKYFSLPESQTVREILATCLGLSSSDQKIVTSDLSNLFSGGRTRTQIIANPGIEFEYFKGAELLKAYSRMLAS